MASNLHISMVAANAEANALAALANGGSIVIYSGTQPATPETALTGTLLATLALSGTAFGSAASGVITANAISNVTIAATGTAAYFRCFESNGTTALFDGTVGTSGCDMNLNSVVLSAGATLSVSSFTFTVPGV
jgi:hypothetical protein